MESSDKPTPAEEPDFLSHFADVPWLWPAEAPLPSEIALPDEPLSLERPRVQTRFQR